MVSKRVTELVVALRDAVWDLLKERDEVRDRWERRANHLMDKYDAEHDWLNRIINEFQESIDPDDGLVNEPQDIFDVIAEVEKERAAGWSGSREDARRDGARSSRPGEPLGTEHQPSSATRQSEYERLDEMVTQMQNEAGHSLPSSLRSRRRFSLSGMSA